MKKILWSIVLLTAISALGLSAAAQGNAKSKTKAKTSKPAAKVTQPANTTYIGETEKNRQNPGNKAVFEPNDEPKAPGSQPVAPGRGSDGRIMDTFDPGARTKPNGTQAPNQSKSTSPTRGQPKNNAATTEPDKKPLPDVVVSSKTARPGTVPKKTAKPKTKPKQ